MWFAILTPGSHPSRPVPTHESTVFCWTVRDRRRIDGPAAAVHGGLRVLRRRLHLDGTPAAPPRCFACRAPCAVPDSDQIRGAPDDFGDLADAAPSCAARDTAMLAYVHLQPLHGAEDPPLDEETLLVMPDHRFAVRVPLALVPGALELLEPVVTDAPLPVCPGCDTILPAAPSSAMSSRREKACNGVPAALAPIVALADAVRPEASAGGAGAGRRGHPAYRDLR